MYVYEFGWNSNVFVRNGFIDHFYYEFCIWFNIWANINMLEVLNYIASHYVIFGKVFILNIWMCI